MEIYSEQSHAVEMIEILNPNPRMLLVFKPGNKEPMFVLAPHDRLATIWQPGTALATTGGISKVILADVPDGDQWVLEVGRKPKRVVRPFD